MFRHLPLRMKKKRRNKKIFSLPFLRRRWHGKITHTHTHTHRVQAEYKVLVKVGGKTQVGSLFFFADWLSTDNDVIFSQRRGSKSSCATWAPPGLWRWCPLPLVTNNEKLTWFLCWVLSFTVFFFNGGVAWIVEVHLSPGRSAADSSTSSLIGRRGDQSASAEADRSRPTADESWNCGFIFSLSLSLHLLFSFSIFFVFFHFIRFFHSKPTRRRMIRFPRRFLGSRTKAKIKNKNGNQILLLLL